MIINNIILYYICIVYNNNIGPLLKREDTVKFFRTHYWTVKIKLHYECARAPVVRRISQYIIYLSDKKKKNQREKKQ